MTAEELRIALADYRRSADLIAKEALEYGHDYGAAISAVEVAAHIAERQFILADATERGKAQYELQRQAREAIERMEAAQKEAGPSEGKPS